MDDKIRKTYEENFQDFWSEIVLDEDGNLNFDQVKRELSDFSFLLDQIPVVYSEITGGKLSKPNYYADTVLEVYRDNMEEVIGEAIDEMIDELKVEIDQCETLEEVKLLINSYNETY